MASLGKVAIFRLQVRNPTVLDTADLQEVSIPRSHRQSHVMVHHRRRG